MSSLTWPVTMPLSVWKLSNGANYTYSILFYYTIIHTCWGLIGLSIYNTGWHCWRRNNTKSTFTWMVVLVDLNHIETQDCEKASTTICRHSKIAQICFRICCSETPWWWVACKTRAWQLRPLKTHCMKNLFTQVTGE